MSVQVADVREDLIVAARKFNKTIGKISQTEAENVLLSLDVGDEAFIVAHDAIVLSFCGEYFVRTDGIVTRLQIALADRGVKLFEW